MEEMLLIVTAKFKSKLREVESKQIYRGCLGQRMGRRK